MTIRDELQPQPDPTPSTGDVWLEIINDLEDNDILKPYCIERRQQGINRYGTPLQRDNGRDHLIDALQEALDLMVYIAAIPVKSEYVWIAQTHAHAAVFRLALEVEARKERPNG